MSDRAPEPHVTFPRADDPYRRAFVGREAELAQMRSAFLSAAQGHGGVLMLSGELGIGKTALCEQLIADVIEHHGTVLKGYSYEETSIPYLPFVEALRSHILAADPEILRAEMGAVDEGLARILPELSERLGLELSVSRQTQNDRWRLLNAVSDLLRGISRIAPLLLVLEDLHWADQASLDLLQHLARNLDGANLLVLGTYRDFDVDLSHPLSTLLAELRRREPFHSIALRGLSPEEVRLMYEVIRGSEVPLRQAELVHELTEGNPLFVREVLRYLIDEGLVVREGGRFVRTDDRPLQRVVPDGLRNVIARRLALHGEAAYETLSLAAVIGREFPFEVLRRVSSLSEAELWQVLNLATRRGTIEQIAGSPAVFRFTHAFFREVLYEEILQPRRSQWHRLVGEALEEVHRHRLEDYAAELADHFARSHEHEALIKGVRYGIAAAERAENVFAYREAISHLEQSLAALDAYSPEDDRMRCQLLLAFGRNLVSAGDPKRYLDEVAPRTIALAQTLGDNEAASAACRESLLAFVAFHGGRGWNESDAMQLAQQAQHLAEPGSISQAWAYSALGRALTAARDISTGHAFADQALALARELEDNPTFWFVAMMWLWTVQGWERAPERLALSLELRQRSREGVNPLIRRSTINAMLQAFLEMGRRSELDEMIADIHQEARRTRQLNLEILSLIYEALGNYWAGRLSEAIETYERTEALTREVGLVSFGLSAWPPGFCEVSILLGRRHTLIERLPDRNAYPALKLALSGEFEGARAYLAEEVTSLEARGVQVERVGVQMMFLEAALLAGDRRIPEAMLEEYKSAEVLFGSAAWGACVPRLLGDAAQLLDRPAEALRYYERALAACEAMRFVPELTLSKLGMAEVIGLDGPQERELVQKLVDEVIAEASAMDMQPALRRAHAVRARMAYTATVRPAYPDGLSAREAEVLRLISAGRSNQQIADELVISLNTVQHHVSSILSKTGTNSRTEAAAYAHRHNLL